MKKTNLFLARIEDWILQSLTYQRPVETDFLSEEEYATLKNNVFHRVDFIEDGGYPQAIRKKVIFNSEGYQSQVVCLKSKYHNKFTSLRHQDVLGALTSLDIKRNQIGDIVIFEDMVAVYTTATMALFIMNHLHKIKHIGVKFQISSEALYQPLQFEEVKINVSSTRMDAIVAGLMHISRKEANRYIVEGLVYVNDVVVMQNSYLCKEQDKITIRRFGKFIFEASLGVSKKERLFLLFKKYI